MLAVITACRRRIAVAAIAVMAIAAAASGAAAQNVLVVVNGDPITAFDIDQRSRFIQISTQKTPARQEVIDELIDEKLKLQLQRRFNMEGIDNDVENAINNMARRMRMNQQQFTQQLASSGVQIGTLKSRIKAEIIWSQVIRGKFQSSFQFNDKDILAALETRKKDDQNSYDYTLRPILFLVPRGSPQAAFEARRREAEALRARFQNCDEGIPFARALRDIAVRDQVKRSSADLPPQLREILEKTEVGRLTPSELTQQGIELYALCEKKQSSADNTLGKREVREELVSEQFQANAKKYLKELRGQAMIEYKK
jgi:peptidyl-prolyl cis-trans isomerase SurA